MIFSRNIVLVALLCYMITGVISSRRVMRNLEKSKRMLEIIKNAKDKFDKAVDENVTIIFGTYDSDKKNAFDFIYRQKTSDDPNSELPSVLVGRQTGIVIFDYPPFRRSDGYNSLTPEQMLYHKMILKLARNVRYILLTPYESYKPNFEYNLQVLIRHAHNVIPNITRDDINIGVVYTNVDYTNPHRPDMVIHRSEFIKSIREWVYFKLMDLKKGTWATNGYSSPGKFRETLRFLSMIMKKADGTDGKIATLGTPRTRALVREDAVLRAFISRIPYSPTPEVQVVDSETLNTVTSIADEINDAVQSSIETLGKEMAQGTMIDDQTMDLDEDYMKFKNIREMFTNLKNENIESIGELVWKVGKVMKSTNMKKFAGSLRPLLENKDAMNDLESFTGTTLTNTSQWLEGFDGFIGHLEQLEKWSLFLKSLHTNLPVYMSEYNVNVEDLLEKVYPRILTYEPYVKIKVKELGLNNIINMITHNRKKRSDESNNDQNFANAYEQVEDMELEEPEAWALAKTLRTSDYKTQVICREGNILEIKGLVINTTEMVNYISENCQQPMQVEVFALRTFIVNSDVDLTGNVSVLAIIGKEWKIYGQRKIILKGIDAMDITKQAQNGTDGSPGLPGGPGAHFLAVAENMIGDGHIFIYASGGNGGKGQDGGNGTDGVDGKFPKALNVPRFNQYASHWNRTPQFFPDEDGATFYNLTNVDYVTGIMELWKFFGSDGKQGNKGGDGGEGGKGGMTGDVVIIELNKANKTTDSSVKGEKGTEGKGGPGGKGGQNGKSVIMRCCNIIISYICDQYVDLGVIGPRAPDGENGKEDNNIIKMKLPESRAPFKLYKTMNRFKEVVREALPESINKMELRNFIFSLEKHSKIIFASDHLTFIEELISLEGQFHILHKAANFTLFYESLLQRIERYSEKSGNVNRDIKLALTTVYAATFSRLCSINSKKNRQMIIDVQHFLSKVIQEIVLIEKVGKEIMIGEQEKEQSKEIDEQLDSAEKILKSDLIPEIGIIAGRVQALINETFIVIANQKRYQEFTKQQEQNRIQNPTTLQKIVSAVEQVSSVLAQITSALKDIKKFGFSSIPIPAFDLVKNAVPGYVIDTVRNISNKKKFFFDKVNVIKPILRSIEDLFRGNKFFDGAKGVLNKIWDSLNSAENKLNTFQMRISDCYTMIQNMTNQLGTLMEEQMEKLIQNVAGPQIEKLKNKADALRNVMQQRNKNLQHFLSNESLMKILQKYENERNTKDSKYGKTDLSELENEMEEGLDGFTLVATRALSDFSRQTPVELPKSINTIKRIIDEVNFNIQSALSGFSLKDEIQAEFESMKKVVDTVVEVINKMGDYRNQKKINGLAADLASSKTPWDVQNKELYKTLNYLTFTMKASKLLVSYERAIHALRQYVFPFADHFLEEFTALPNIKPGKDFKDILSTIVPQIRKLYSSLDDWATNINHHDTFIFKDVQFTDYYFQPFYKFKYSTFKMKIRNLFQGKKTSFATDVRDGVNKEAIKFNKIGINFKLLDKTKQNKFNRILRNYDVDMVHFGNNFYRCHKRYFLISSEKQMISYSFEVNEKGDPLRTNTVYDKLAASDYFLSPYSIWTIKLSNVVDNVDHLQEFLDEPIDLLFEGRGQYVQINKDMIKLCEGQLEKHYTEFDPDAEINDILISAYK